MTSDIIIRRAEPADSASVSLMLTAQPEAYIMHFKPFSFSAEEIKKRFLSAKADRYWILNFGNELAGFFMLRGFDEGYEIPSFGVVISKPWSGKGLSALALQYSISWCKANGIAKLMLKVHPDNSRAKEIYERFGFEKVKIDPKNANMVYELSLHGVLK